MESFSLSYNLLLMYTRQTPIQVPGVHGRIKILQKYRLIYREDASCKTMVNKASIIIIGKATYDDLLSHNSSRFLAEPSS